MDNKFLNKFTSLVFYLSIFIFIIAFSFAHNPKGAWTQQFMPFLSNRPLADIIFLDSLTGYAVTGDLNTGGTDTNYILKSTNSGDNWNIIHRSNYDFIRIIFLNRDSGYASTTSELLRTTDAGLSWNFVLIPPGFGKYDMFAISYDTIWITFPYFQGDYIYRSTNAGQTWTNQLIGNGFEKIYFFNNRIGFIGSTTTNVLLKTTNSGLNWISIPGQNGFREIIFIDSLTGWKSISQLRKTTNGGLEWVNVEMPSGGNLIISSCQDFSLVNKDTIWAVGGTVLFQGNEFRGNVYRTINGGTNWSYQIPDTSIHISQYYYCNFVNRLNGWVYDREGSGVHTTIGGDTTFVTDIKAANSNAPEDFILHQNYPNPFNPKTTIEYELQTSGYVIIKVYNIQGKETSSLINKKQPAGKYKTEFDASDLTSGAYFYSMFLDGVKTDTKKMLLIR